MDLKDRLATRMAQLKVTNTALANEVGVTVAAVGHWLAGRSTPTDDKLKVIATFLGTDALWLKTGKRVKKFRRLPPEQVPKVLFGASLLHRVSEARRILNELLREAAVEGFQVEVSVDQPDEGEIPEVKVSLRWDK